MSYVSYEKYSKLEELIGKTLVKCQKTEFDNNDAIRFETTDGTVYYLSHLQDCCESVHLEDLDGDLQDLVGSPITLAECVDGEAPADTPEYGDWSFYRFQTAKGFVFMRWYGESEYYGTGVDFFRSN